MCEIAIAADDCIVTDVAVDLLCLAFVHWDRLELRIHVCTTFVKARRRREFLI